ncbi:NADP-dependent 3-hydroxy acid dehydrogenase YdfG [Enterococcus malodoratus]|uniref:SDR family oxidoreductase n=1 Tax=Enterococcus malodoratus TaxID=71451 RepID=UPI0008C0206E|nr:SDR family oxidoreductase [Enterococcus malodoratus]SET53252.1 NADP-dependent 3-hydroxy acid dehydrogenase YdfG [Enterococcus malodoratus]
MTESKVIVIAGASSGIGEASAKLLAKNGNKLVLGARREGNLKEIVSQIQSNNGEAVYQVTDVTNNQQVESLVKLAITTFGRIDVMINSAGIMPHSLLKDKRIQDWDRMIDINIKGTLYGVGAVLPYMNKQKIGQIINISSVAGHYAHAGGAVYSATKWAVRAISESLREEVAQNGSNIRVTIVSPGAINTELLSSVTDPALKENYEQFYGNFGISADRVATTIQQAIDLPADAAWNEVIIRPTKQVQ